MAEKFPFLAKISQEITGKRGTQPCRGDSVMQGDPGPLQKHHVASVSGGWLS